MGSTRVVSGEVEAGRGRKGDPCLPGSVRVGAGTHRDDGFTLEERRPGSVTPAARQGLCTGARDPSLADTPLLSTDSVDSTGPAQAVSSGSHGQGAGVRCVPALARPVPRRGPQQCLSKSHRKERRLRGTGAGFSRLSLCS